MIESIKLSNSINVHKIHQPKFNEVLVNLKIRMPLKPFQNTVASLLVRIMSDRTEVLPSKQAMREHLDFLYGAKTSTQTYTLGTDQVLDITVKAIHSKFVSEDLLKEQLSLLESMVYTPLISEQTLNEAKVNLKHYHARLKESTSSYALQQAFQSAAPGSLLELNSLGDLEDIDKVSLEDVRSLHLEVIENFAKDLILVGDVESFNSFEMFEKGGVTYFSEPLWSANVESRFESSKHNGSQTELVMIYSSDITPRHPLYSAYLVFTAILGQLPSSYLFQNIREKHSLAYSIYASRQLYDGLLYICTGTNDLNLDKAITLVKEQFEAIREDDLDIEGAVLYLSMSLEGTFEKLKPIADHTYRNLVLGLDDSIEAIQDKLKKVKEEDVKAVLNHLSEPFIYAYRGENNENNS